MHKFPISDYRKFSELPLDLFDSFKFSIYLLDFDWNYLFVNRFVVQNLGAKVEDLVGKNMWKKYPELKVDPAFQQMKATIEKGSMVNMTTTSPLTAQRLNITGYRLDDCLYFSASILPDKAGLLNELRNSMKKPKSL